MSTLSPTTGPSVHAPLASTSLDLLDRSRGSLLLACRTGDVGERYVEAHLGALRAAAALLAARSLPGSTGAPATSGATIRAGRSARPTRSATSGPAGTAGGTAGTAGGTAGTAGGTALPSPAGPARPLVGSSRSRPRSVWELLPRVAPELTEWAAFFAASARRRAAVERGSQIVARESDDLLRQAEIFLEIIQDLLGLPRTHPLGPLSGYVAPISRSGGSGRE